MEKSPRVWITSIVAFSIIGVLNSCNSIHVNQQKKIHEMMNLEPPKITINDILKPKPTEEISKWMKNEEEIEENEEIFAK